jgi:hypothetical protein
MTNGQANLNGGGHKVKDYCPGAPPPVIPGPTGPVRERRSGQSWNFQGRHRASWPSLRLVSLRKG